MSLLLLSTLSLLSGLLLGVSGMETPPTYEHRDPLSGETLMCTKCPPGTHMSAHCTSTTPTQCTPCRDEYFTELWNYLPRCLYCYNFCTDNQEVERNCTKTSNRVCRCKEGFYGADDFCIPHSECSPGQGVLTKGTSKRNTVCERCSDGYFSRSSSALDMCIKHQECSSGDIVLLQGSTSHDTVCGSCENLAKGGETLRTFLSGFFSMHKIGRIGKIKRFIDKYIHISEEDRCLRETSASKRQRGPLLHEIREWLSKAPEDQLRKVPLMLRDSQLNSLADKLQKRLSEIKLQSPDCTLSV